MDGHSGLVTQRYHLHWRIRQERREAYVRQRRVIEGYTLSLQFDLEGNVRRAIDIQEGENVDEFAFKALVREAVALNGSGKSKTSKKAK